MRILFILSFLMFVYSFLRIKKCNKKLNVLLWIPISIMIFMCFNSLTVFVLSYINIASTLLIRSIINIVLSLIVFFVTRKEKQSYIFDLGDLFVVYIIFALVSFIFLIRFGFDFRLDFEMSDAIVHYNNAESFYSHNLLIEKIKENTILFDSSYGSTSLLFSYTNMGTLFQLGDKIVGEYNLYKLFIIFELFSYLMGGILFYFLVKRENTSIKNYFITICFVISYMLGYPLLNLLMGFHYWHLSLLLTMCLLLFIKYFFDMDKNKCLTIIGMSLLSLGLFFCYYLFVPLVYFIIGLYILSKYKIEKKISLKQSLLYLLFILGIPFIIGMVYYFLYPYLAFDGSGAYVMNIDGTNYRNLIGNLLFFIPLIIWKVIQEIKNKNYSLELISLLSTVLFTIVLFILCLTNKLSIYYYYKIYLYLWLFDYIYLVKILYESKLSLAKIYLYSYLIIVFFGLINIELKIENTKTGMSSNSIIINLTDVYRNNITLLQTYDGYLDKNKKDIINYVITNFDTVKNIRGEIPFVASYFEKMWYAQIYKIKPSNKYSIKNELYVNRVDSYESDPDTRYFVWIYDSDEEDKIDISKYNVVYENNSGCVLEKK